MEYFFASHGYPALFLVSFLASTLLPLGSEWLLVALLLKGYDAVTSVAVATAGNTLGACTTYLIGSYGGPFLVGRVLRISDEARRKAENLYQRYGCWSLLFSWVPVVGDPLCFVGGVLRVRFARFSLLVLGGKLARYALVGFMTLSLKTP